MNSFCFCGLFLHLMCPYMPSHVSQAGSVDKKFSMSVWYIIDKINTHFTTSVVMIKLLKMLTVKLFVLLPHLFVKLSLLCSLLVICSFVTALVLHLLTSMWLAFTLNLACSSGKGQATATAVCLGAIIFKNNQATPPKKKKLGLSRYSFQTWWADSIPHSTFTDHLSVIPFFQNK